MYWYSIDLRKWLPLANDIRPLSFDLAANRALRSYAVESFREVYYISNGIQTFQYNITERNPNGNIHQLRSELVQQYLPPYTFMPAKFHGGNWRKTNYEVIMFHSPEKALSAVGYIQKPGDKRRVSYTFAWNIHDYVQMVPLHQRAYHAGRKWNRIALSICLPGPVGIDLAPYVGRTKKLINKIERLYGRKFPVTSHRLVEAKKRDPGRDDFEFLMALGYKNHYMTKKGLIIR